MHVIEEKHPARIHVLLARDARYGVVIRRGPSKHTCFAGWDRTNDTFEPSQWLMGRVYERRSDLSPDGRHIIYFAMNGKWKSETRGSWTAISKSPWMKSIALFAKGDCWHGGGLFLDNRTCWLNNGYGHEILQQTRDITISSTYQPKENYGGECPGVYFVRLQRDGWELKNRERHDKSHSKTIFEKPLPQGWTLRKISHAQIDSPKGKGCFWDEHVLISRAGEIQEHPNWEWADLDEMRIVWASNGCLHARTIQTGSKLGETKTLYDFNEMQFTHVTAPY
jgi:hypothetical protein